MDELLITLLRRRRMIGAFGLVGGLLGLALALLVPRSYVSSATFIPQSSEVSMSGLALAASQFGIRMPSSGGTWGPATYVELLRSEPLLRRIAAESLAVPEKGGQRIALMDLLEIPDDSPARRTARTVARLRKIVLPSEDKKINAVKLDVTTRWPSVSLALAQQLVTSVNQFNLETRKSQASAERQFVERQADDARAALRVAEDRLEEFLQRNRSLSGSPDLTFARDRLQREVELRQSLYTSLMQEKESARIKEVRDTPVITVIETPQLPVMSKPRGTIVKCIVGAVAFAVLAMFIAFVSDNVAAARVEDPKRREELAALARSATTPFVHRTRADGFDSPAR